MSSSATSGGLEEFADSLKKAYSSGVKVQPEAQLTGPVQRLVETLAPGLSVKSVHTSREATVEEVGRPDIAVAIREEHPADAGGLPGELPLLGEREDAVRRGGRDKARRVRGVGL